MNRSRLAGCRTTVTGGLVLLVILLAACAPSTPVPPTPPMSLWGEVFTITQVEQGAAPALMIGKEAIAAAWIGADETGVHQDIRLIMNGSLLERVVLPLPPVHPYAQSLAPAETGFAHFLWLDADSERGGETRLFTANVRLTPPTPQVERGPIRASDRQTFRYAAVQNGDGSLWVVWSGGQAAEPALYAQYIDSLSRPRQPQLLVENGDWPALARADDGTVYVFWIQADSRTRVFYARLGDGVLLDIQSVVTLMPPARGDRLVSMSAGLDRTHGYLLWNLTRANGSVETWFSSGALGSAIWKSPARLGIAWDSAQTFETGFNSRTAFAARAGDQWARWGSPASGQFETLPAAAQIGDDLAALYFRGGEIAGYQSVAPVSSPLIGLPAIDADRDGHLYLAWSQPAAAGYADLKVTGTR